MFLTCLKRCFGVDVTLMYLWININVKLNFGSENWACNCDFTIQRSRDSPGNSQQYDWLLSADTIWGINSAAVLETNYTNVLKILPHFTSFFTILANFRPDPLHSRGRYRQTKGAMDPTFWHFSFDSHRYLHVNFQWFPGGHFLGVCHSLSQRLLKNLVPPGTKGLHKMSKSKQMCAKKIIKIEIWIPQP